MLRREKNKSQLRNGPKHLPSPDKKYKHTHSRMIWSRFQISINIDSTISTEIVWAEILIFFRSVGCSAVGRQADFPKRLGSLLQSDSVFATVSNGFSDLGPSNCSKRSEISHSCFWDQYAHFLWIRFSIDFLCVSRDGLELEGMNFQIHFVDTHDFRLVSRDLQKTMLET